MYYQHHPGVFIHRALPFLKVPYIPVSHSFPVHDIIVLPELFPSNFPSYQTQYFPEPPADAYLASICFNAAVDSFLDQISESQHKARLSLSWLVTWNVGKAAGDSFPLVPWDFIKSGTFSMVSSICGRVSFVPISYIGVTLLKWLSAAPCCTSPSDLQRMSSLTAGPGSSRGMLMDLFGSLPLEAGGMDLFHLMSVWGSGGEERITGWHRFNWQGEEEEGKKTPCNVSLTRQRAEHRLFWGDCFSSVTLAGLRSHQYTLGPVEPVNVPLDREHVKDLDVTSPSAAGEQGQRGTLTSPKLNM